MYNIQDICFYILALNFFSSESSIVKLYLGLANKVDRMLLCFTLEIEEEIYPAVIVYYINV